MKKKNKESFPNDQPPSWHSRGYLPHFDGGKQQFITFRLADSMPKDVLDRWRKELEKKVGVNFESALPRRIEVYLDQGYGECYLKDHRVAKCVQDSLLFYDGKRYKLSAWVVMPNNVHLLVTPGENE